MRSVADVKLSVIRHPVEGYWCPTCKAQAGSPCKAPNTGKTRSPHRSRWIESGLIGPFEKVPAEVK